MLFKLKNIFFLLLITLLCSNAYASTCSERTAVSDPVLRAFQKAKVCCKNFSDFKYKSIGFGMFSSKLSTFRSGKKAYNFETGKSYFAAFELPEFESPYLIAVTSGPGEAYHPLFYPEIMILDKDYQVIHETDEFTMQDTGRSRIGAKISVESLEAKYVIVKTTDKALASCSSLVFTTGNQYADVSFSLFYAHSPMGKVLLSLEEVE